MVAGESQEAVFLVFHHSWNRRQPEYPAPPPAHLSRPNPLSGSWRVGLAPADRTRTGAQPQGPVPEPPRTGGLSEQVDAWGEAQRHTKRKESGDER